ncbi:MAG: glutaredoxin family protein [Candidatus Lokiarchaeota archaeon]|nr:glutaredoxin family protein [Candidatus Lokiarchaeota archaeon]
MVNIELKRIEFTHIQGNKKDWKVRLYALSTCGHCHRVMGFLKEHSIEFSYVYVDYLDRKIIKKLRAHLKEKFGRVVSYPFLVVDDERFLQGFIEAKFREMFNIE